MPQRLNKLAALLEERGLTLRALAQEAENACIVLVERSHNMHPFVTWLYNADDNAFYHGHYLSTEAEGNEDFLVRSRRKALIIPG